MEQILLNKVMKNITRHENGVFFKDAQAFESGEGVCYVCEVDIISEDFHYRDEDDNLVVNGYARKDFLDLCGGNPHLARELFGEVSWQSPYTLFSEWDEHGYLDEWCDKSGDINPEYKPAY